MIPRGSRWHNRVPDSHYDNTSYSISAQRGHVSLVPRSLRRSADSIQHYGPDAFVVIFDGKPVNPVRVCDAHPWNPHVHNRDCVYVIASTYTMTPRQLRTYVGAAGTRTHPQLMWVASALSQWSQRIIDMRGYVPAHAIAISGRQLQLSRPAFVYVMRPRTCTHVRPRIRPYARRRTRICYWPISNSQNTYIYTLGASTAALHTVSVAHNGVEFNMGSHAIVMSDSGLYTIDTGRSTVMHNPGAYSAVWFPNTTASRYK